MAEVWVRSRVQQLLQLPLPMARWRSAAFFASGGLFASVLTIVVLGSVPASSRTRSPFTPRRAGPPHSNEAAVLQADSGGWQTPRITEPTGNPLWDIFSAHQKGPLIDKWHQYFDVYHRYFRKFRGQNVTLLEIGVQSGGTISMWQQYFGRGLTIYGVDINPYCKGIFDDPPQVNIYIGNQASREFWAEMRALDVTFDIILDDGGHTMQQQITTFEEAWPMLAEGGVWLTEDTATSMDFTGRMQMKKIVPTERIWGGGYGKASTWVAYAKQFADIVNGHYVVKAKHPEFDPLDLTPSLLSAAFYDQMVVLEKGNHPLASESRQGSFEIPYNDKGHAVNAGQLEQYRDTLAAALRQP